MQTKTKIALFGAVLMVAFFWSGDAKADYWTRHTRSSSGNVLPQYFELENMAKSSNGIKLFYGTNRVGGVGSEAEVNHTRHLLAFDGTNWEDLTDLAKNESGGVNDIKFDNMYADSSGNVWMSNHKDGERRLMRYSGSVGASSIVSWSSTTIADQAFPGNEESSLRINNLFSGPNGLTYAVAQGDSRLYILYHDGTSWHDSAITGDPLTDSGNQCREVFGIYNSADESFWIYKYKSSENEYSDPSGGDVGIGIWKYKGGNWTQYNSADTTADGTALKNGVTDAFSDSNGNIWVGTRYGVYKYDYTSGNWTNWTKDNSNIFTNRVIKIQQDSDGRIWIIALEDERVENDNGGISIYNNDGTWDYYTSYNGEDALATATNIFMIGGDEAWMFTGHGEEAMSAGIYALTRDDAHTALYGQVSGTTVEKASLDGLKKKKSTAKKVTITKKWRVKVKKKWKWRKKVVYRGKSSSGWYKKLNLDAGANIKYIIKIQGKRARTVSASSGDPIRVNFN